MGVHWSPLFWLEDVDLDYGTPPGVWVTWGTGTFRLQVDYQRSRQQYSIYSGVRMIETYQGQQDTPVYRALQRTAVNHVGEALVYWRVLDHARVSPHLLVGFQYLNIGERRCFATGEPVPREPDGYHVDFAPGEETTVRRRSADAPSSAPRGDGRGRRYCTWLPRLRPRAGSSFPGSGWRGPALLTRRVRPRYL